MEDLLKIIVNSILNEPTVIYALGWVLFIVERYYLADRREKRYESKLAEREKTFREDLEAFRSEYNAVVSNIGETFTRFSVLLELIKDRVHSRGDK